MIMWGYMKRASQMGAKLYEGVRATGLSIRNGQMEGVITDKGFLSTGWVVNAGGPWAAEAGRWVDIEIPIKNSARCIVVTGALHEIPSETPFVEDLTAEWYFRPEGAGVLMGMGSVATEKLDIQIHHEMMEEMIDAAVHRVPILEKAPVLTAWTGIRPLTDDDLPILGPLPSVKGFVLNCGWGGMGIILAPVAGQLIAEYIVNGYCTTMDIRPFRLERFAMKMG
jgi:glycine/D-amino acid oxidase-like deaminating enzyme